MDPVPSEPTHNPDVREEFIEGDHVNYNKIYEQLQERFHKAYSLSQKLFITEKAQRQALYHSKRKNLALLEILRDVEKYEEAYDDLPLQIDSARIERLIEAKPFLKNTLEPLIRMGHHAPAATIELKPSYPVNLAVDEAIPEVENDELDSVELNPQETEMWNRRNFSHLVVSKFKPVEIRTKGVREYVDSPASSKRRKANAA